MAKEKHEGNSEYGISEESINKHLESDELRKTKDKLLNSNFLTLEEKRRILISNSKTEIAEILRNHGKKQ